VHGVAFGWLYDFFKSDSDLNQRRLDEFGISESYLYEIDYLEVVPWYGFRFSLSSDVIESFVIYAKNQPDWWILGIFISSA